MDAATNETMDYSEDGGEYNADLQCWVWKNDRGQPHREGDKPAMIFDNGDMIWQKNGMPHRLTGKAWISHGSGNVLQWFIEGRRYNTKKKFEKARNEYIKEHGDDV